MNSKINDSLFMSLSITLNDTLNGRNRTADEGERSSFQDPWSKLISWSFLTQQFYNFEETIWWISRVTKCGSRELCIFNSRWSHFYNRLSLDPVQPRTILSNPIQTFSISFVRICSWTFKRPRKVFLSSGVTVKIG